MAVKAVRIVWEGNDTLIGNERIKSLLDLYADAINRGDLDAITSFYSEFSIVSLPYLEMPLIGAKANRQHWSFLLSTFPGLEIRMFEPVCEGSRYAVEWQLIVPCRDDPSRDLSREDRLRPGSVDLCGASIVRLADDETALEERRYFWPDAVRRLAEAAGPMKRHTGRADT